MRRQHFLTASIFALALGMGATTPGLGIAPAAHAQTTAADAEPAALTELVDEVDIPYEKFTLDNGLDVIVHTDRKAPVVAVAVWSLLSKV